MSGLDHWMISSYVEGGQLFVYAWGDKLGDAIDRMPKKD
jgi:hypothetical protein